MKNPSNYPIKSFARLKTTLIFKKSVALIVICKGGDIHENIFNLQVTIPGLGGCKNASWMILFILA